MAIPLTSVCVRAGALAVFLIHTRLKLSRRFQSREMATFRRQYACLNILLVLSPPWPCLSRRLACTSRAVHNGHSTHRQPRHRTESQGSQVMNTFLPSYITCKCSSCFICCFPGRPFFSWEAVVTWQLTIAFARINLSSCFVDTSLGYANPVITHQPDTQHEPARCCVGQELLPATSKTTLQHSTHQNEAEGFILHRAAAFMQRNAPAGHRATESVRQPGTWQQLDGPHGTW